MNGQSGEEGDEEQKRMARMQRNRESAMLSRQRKKMQLDELDRQNKQLQATNTHLSGAPSPAQSCYVLLIQLGAWYSMHCLLAILRLYEA